MGVKHGGRRHGKVDSALAAEHIGVPKRKRPADDPYSTEQEHVKSLGNVLSPMRSRLLPMLERAQQRNGQL